ncbi:GDSL-type esterase/lipase family protein [Corynebacterium bovis]|uniref:GDSL-type esterase/lipase family protein n=1 Tax=Corynebacterium bovis TaxID=36808 RepID=UPI00313963D0
MTTPRPVDSHHRAAEPSAPHRERAPRPRHRERASRPRHRRPPADGRVGWAGAVAAAAVGLAAVTVALGPGTTSADAEPEGNVVYLGDSFTANPDQTRNLTRDINPLVFDGYPSREGCLQSPHNAPRQLADLTGVPVADWSCTAQTSRGSLHRIDRAIAAGDIHPGTRAVVLAAGMNNYGPYGALDGVDILDPRAVRDAYLADMHAAADRVRAVAPGARIIVPGQLTVADPVTAVYCAVNVVPDRPVGFPLPLLRDVENWNRANQVDAAREIGATYVEVCDGSADHHSCAPDAERWVAGVVDTTTPDYHMMFHPSRAGSAFVARRIAGALP